jgi:hypothetical protein
MDFNVPQYEGRQWSPVSAVEAGQAWIQQQDAKKHALEQMYIQNQQSSANLDRYQQQTPHEVAKSGLAGAQAGIMNTPQMLESYRGGQQGLHQTQQAAGQYDQATVGGRADATNSKSLVESFENTARALELAAASGSLGAQESWDQIYKGMPQNVRGHFSPQYTPDTPEKIRKLARAVDESPAHRRSMEINDQKLGIDLQLAGFNNQAAQLRAETAADARINAPHGSTAAETPPKAIARLNSELRKDPNNEGAKRELGYYLNKEFVDDFAKDPRAMILSTQPAKAQELELYQGWSRAKYFDQHGLDNPVGQLSFDEFRWVDAAMKSNHGATLEQVLAEGRKRGRIKSRARK